MSDDESCCPWLLLLRFVSLTEQTIKVALVYSTLLFLSLNPPALLYKKKKKHSKTSCRSPHLGGGMLVCSLQLCSCSWILDKPESISKWRLNWDTLTEQNLSQNTWLHLSRFNVVKDKSEFIPWRTPSSVESSVMGQPWQQVNQKSNVSASHGGNVSCITDLTITEAFDAAQDVTKPCKRGAEVPFCADVFHSFHLWISN